MNITDLENVIPGEDPQGGVIALILNNAQEILVPILRCQASKFHPVRSVYTHPHTLTQTLNLSLSRFLSHTHTHTHSLTHSLKYTHTHKHTYVPNTHICTYT